MDEQSAHANRSFIRLSTLYVRVIARYDQIKLPGVDVKEWDEYS